MLLNCLSNFQQDSFLRMKVKSKNLYEWLGKIICQKPQEALQGKFFLEEEI